MIFVNFKTYQRGTGANAIALVRLLQTVSQETGVKIVSVVQASDVREVCSETTLPVWVQNVDVVGFGAHTGSVLPEAVFEDGAVGTFLNHSEHKYESMSLLKKANTHALGVGLSTLIFAGSTDELKGVVEFKPTYVSYEPPELVGSKTTSVSESKPEVISKAVEIANKNDIPLIVGAGIKSAEDVRVGLARGATGFAVASAIVDSEDPKGKLMELIGGYE